MGEQKLLTEGKLQTVISCWIIFLSIILVKYFCKKFMIIYNQRIEMKYFIFIFTGFSISIENTL